MRSLAGKRAVVTGGAMGIGLATVRRLVKEGVTVAIWDINDKAMAEVENEFKEVKDRVFIYKCDITKKEMVKESADKTKKDIGPVDILINNAGSAIGGRFCDKSLEQWDWLTQINLNSLYYTTYEFLPDMYERNTGHIVNVSSGAGVLGLANLAVYCATKFAVYGFTEALRIEAMTDKKNIVFSSIHPGLIKTGLFEGGKFNFLGNLIFPLLESHDKIGEVIVNKALKKNKVTVLRPFTIRSGFWLRAIMSDKLLCRIVIMAGGGTMMSKWTGHGSK